jgi:hypothetical protein
MTSKVRLHRFGCRARWVHIATQIAWDPNTGGQRHEPGRLDTQTLLQHLPGVRFPAEKEQVAATAEQNDAPQELVQKIRDADTQRFDGPDEVLQAVQGR